MAEPAASARADGSDNTEYRIGRAPDLQTVTPGAHVRYRCDWAAPGAPPTVAGQDYWGPRDGVRWYSYGDRAPKRFWQQQVRTGPASPAWDCVWDQDPGRYTVIAEIRSRLAPDRPPTYCYLPQQVGDAGALLRNGLDALIKDGAGPSPGDAESEIGRYRRLLGDIAKRLPPSDPAGRRAHERTVGAWTELAGRLRALLAPTDDRRRIPVRGLHLETATQARRPLLLFLSELGDVQRARGRAGVVVKKRWVLVDWTDASDPRFRGDYEGEGDSPKEAIESAFSSWDWGNRYPEGQVTFDVPAGLRQIVGGPASRQMDTDGKTVTDLMIGAFEWIAIGGMLVAGFCFVFVSIPALISASMATSVLASTAGAVFSVGQRWRAGIFDWRADAIDGLTVAGNIVGAGAWARGARVRTLGDAGKTLDYVFIGARVAADAAQGVLVAASRIDELDRLMKAPDLAPEERARKILALFAELVAVGLMTAVSFRASAKEADSLDKRPRHFADDPRSNTPGDRLDALTNPREVVDTTQPPVAEGHTNEGGHKTTLNTGVAPAPAGRLGPKETEFAKFYPGGRQWRKREIGTSEIELIDRDGFRFHAVCKKGTLDITIATVFDPVANPPLIPYFPQFASKEKSKVMKAESLYPKMYKHFEQVGNPVTTLDSSWAWTNYADAKVKFDELLAAGASEKEAAVAAVKSARSYRYHLAQGFTKVVSASHRPGLFKFVMVKE
jgi:hypothetical protein